MVFLPVFIQGRNDKVTCSRLAKPGEAALRGCLSVHDQTILGDMTALCGRAIVHEEQHVCSDVSTWPGGASWPSGCTWSYLHTYLQLDFDHQKRTHKNYFSGESRRLWRI